MSALRRRTRLLLWAAAAVAVLLLGLLALNYEFGGGRAEWRGPGTGYRNTTTLPEK